MITRARAGLVMPGLEQSGAPVWLRAYEARIVYAHVPNKQENGVVHGPEGADPLHRRPRWQ